MGSQEQIGEAFTAAGWVGADSNSNRAVFKQFSAFLTLSNYPNMPISRQLLNGQLQDATWQKSFNAYGRREHLRLWGQTRTVQNQRAWLGAYTRETSAVLSLRYHSFIHHIDRNLDDGVNMLVRDLTLTGCVESVRQLPRPDLARVLVNSTGDEMKTEGMLTVVHFKDCGEPSIQYARGNPLIPIHPKSRIARYFRSQILVYKSDVIRGNIVYSAFDLTRMSVRSFRHRHDSSIGADDDDLPMSPVSPDTLFPPVEPGEIPLGR